MEFYFSIERVGAPLAVARSLTGLSCWNDSIIYIYRIVGASIARPAVKYIEFAEDRCEFVTFCRADERCSPLHPKFNINVAIVQYRKRNVAGDCEGRPYGVEGQKKFHNL